MIRHDREPGFMSDFFRAFNKILEQRQRATMAYRPQANGTAERMVQTATRALKMEVIADQASRHNKDVGSHRIEAGSRYTRGNWVKEGYARKLAHLWHGPFRVAEKINEFSIKLKIAGTRYQIFPVVHVSKLKLAKDFPDRPRIDLTVDESDRLDFDEILPERAGFQVSEPTIKAYEGRPSREQEAGRDRQPLGQSGLNHGDDRYGSHDCRIPRGDLGCREYLDRGILRNTRLGRK
ncbi:LOW QUALITY PROTEIN: hypothetical protein PHMEG_00023095 [Phytophthora megakarya]|uniref:Reverse transcriptase n=1 Tax=Phytophthora megakarya TaxID=4795 RepID=A0A225VJ71_9STRA|nr:LOW QUALITY PROTEIN: hypothetical protein PHMEG_00023095 [Phytophthora megakarya]